jgi:hypothetical protein
MRGIEEIKALVERLAVTDAGVAALAAAVGDGERRAVEADAAYRAAVAANGGRDEGSFKIGTYGLPSLLSAAENLVVETRQGWMVTRHELDRRRRDLRREQAALSGLEPARLEVQILCEAEAEADLAFADRKRALDEKIAAAEEVEREGDGAATAAAIGECRELNASLDVLDLDRAAFVALARGRLLAVAAAEALTTIEREAPARIRASDVDPSAMARVMGQQTQDALAHRFGQDVASRVFALIERRLADGAYHEQEPAVIAGAGGK